MIPCFLSNARIKSPILLQYPAHVKADLDGTIFTYDYRARLAYAMTFDHPHAHNFLIRRPHVSYDCRGSYLHDMICREVMTDASRAR